MELFDSHRKKFLRRFSLLLPLCFLILISSIFFISVSFASDETLHKEQQALEQALENGAIPVICHEWSISRKSGPDSE